MILDLRGRVDILSVPSGKEELGVKILEFFMLVGKGVAGAPATQPMATGFVYACAISVTKYFNITPVSSLNIFCAYLMFSLPCHRGKPSKLLLSDRIASAKYNDQFKIYQRNPSCQCPVVPQTYWDPGPKLRTTADPRSQRKWGEKGWVHMFSAKFRVTVACVSPVSLKNCVQSTPSTSVLAV